MHGALGRDTMDEPICVLVVEDNLNQRVLLAQLLRCWGYEVLEAPDGAVALEYALQDRQRIDLMILDIMLPVVDGIEVARQVLGRDPSLPVLACSAVLEGGNVEQLRRLGVRTFLPKPFTTTALLGAIREIERHHRNGDG